MRSRRNHAPPGPHGRAPTGKKGSDPIDLLAARLSRIEERLDGIEAGMDRPLTTKDFERQLEGPKLADGPRRRLGRARPGARLARRSACATFSR